MKKFTFNVTQTVEVELDETLFTEKYLKAFSEVMWEVDDIKDVAEYIARQKAIFDGYDVEFVPVDGYTAEIVGEEVEEG